MQVRVQQIGPGMVQQIQSVCGECQGQGERINAKDRCKSCVGKKVCLNTFEDSGSFIKNTLQHTTFSYKGY